MQSGSRKHCFQELEYVGVSLSKKKVLDFGIDRRKERVLFDKIPRGLKMKPLLLHKAPPAVKEDPYPTCTTAVQQILLLKMLKTNIS